MNDGDSNLDDYALGSLEAYVAVKKALKKVSSPPTAAQLKSVQQLIARRPKSKAKTRAKPKAKPARKKR